MKNLDRPKTVATQGKGGRGSGLGPEAFVPGWDAKPGALQHDARDTERAGMGNKMTPPGRSRLIKGK